MTIHTKIDNEIDPLEEMLKRTGCIDKHYKVQECYSEKQDWRKCQDEVKDFRKCMELHNLSKNKVNDPNLK